MSTTSHYTIEQFVEDAKACLAAAGGDRDRVVRELSPKFAQVLWDDGLWNPKYLVTDEPGRPTHRYYRAEDGSLQIYLVEFKVGMPTPVHDHVTWGLIGVAGGKQRTERWVRHDDRSDPTQAKLEKISDEVLVRGDHHPLLPPDDIHLIETVGDESSYSLHVLGVDLGRHHRNIYDTETGAITQTEGRM